MEEQCNNSNLKLRTARTLKWNTIDRLASQLLYGVVGIVLANNVSKTAFGLMGVILVFQAFATIFVDGGFATALLQKKNPDETDYSTVFWFNLAAAITIYGILWPLAPAIARLFHNSQELVPMCRLSFLCFIFTGLGIVQTNLLTKQMDMKQVAVANIVSQTISGTLAIFLALRAYGAWALVWQGVSQTFIKSAWLWWFGSWRLKLIFNITALKGIMKVGGNMFGASFLSTACNNIYSFIIGIFYPLSSLGIYTQADKWSKMGQASLSQIFTSTFIPLMSGVQDNRPRFLRLMGKATRLAAFITIPFLGGLIITAAPIFHILFGNKWDAAIPLFQILCARGAFVVFAILYSNFILALGYARQLFWAEALKDIFMIAAIFVALPFGSVEALVWGLLVSSVASWGVMLGIAIKTTRQRLSVFFTDIAPYLATGLIAMTGAHICSLFINQPAPLFLSQVIVGAGLYWLILKISGSVALREATDYLTGKMRKNG